MTKRTLGVEEELLLVDPHTHHLTAVAQQAVRAQGRNDADVDSELFLQQLETATEPVTGAAELEAAIRAGRAAVLDAATAAGAQAVAMPLPVLLGQEERITPKPRYRQIAAEYGEMARQGLTCAMHVHVQVADEDEGVAVIDRVRPWLPVLLALSANSPLWDGRDTGHASWRSQMWSRWPSGGPREALESPAAYNQVADRLVSWGAALDRGMLYYDIRLAERFPTVEIRVADVCTEVDDALLVALLARALVSTAADDLGPQVSSSPWRSDLLKAAGWRAGRYGVAGPLVHPDTLELAPTRQVVNDLVALVKDALVEAGDLDLVGDLFERLLARGSGAARQRSVLESTGSLEAVVADLAERTVPD